MRDFEKIEWKKYNKPPFYQQFLCKDETLKLTSFGDKGLSEIDEHILSLKDQWDLDNVEGHFLDRIGKLLSEPRNGADDDFYRLALNLRKLLNTNNGSIPDIIRTIKYLYSSEVVHIVPDYPAGIIIEHDGEGTPGINFNRLIAEVVPAGVSFSTKELFAFTENFNTEEFTIGDELTIIVRRITSDSFDNGLKYNGRGKYDGHTLNNSEIVNFKFDGKHKYNGVIQYRIETIEADSHVEIPFKFRSGIRDRLTANTPQVFTDYAQSQAKYNGVAKYDGNKNYTGFGNDSVTDVLKKTINAIFADSKTTVENMAVQINKPLDDRFTTHKETLSIAGENSTVTDMVNMNDGFSAGLRFQRKFDGKYNYDGAITYNGNILIPV